MFKYLIRNTLSGSSKYGNCDICTKSCDTVYYQSEEREYQIKDRPKSWTTSDCRDLFGHKECLEGVRKSPNVIEYYKGEKV